MLVAVGGVGLPLTERARGTRLRRRRLDRRDRDVGYLAVLGATEVPNRDLVREREKLRQRREQRHRAGQ